MARHHIYLSGLVLEFAIADTGSSENVAPVVVFVLLDEESERLAKASVLGTR